MVTNIHPTALIDPTATLADGVVVGPYSIIGPHCHVGEGTQIGAHVVLESYTTLGKHCQVSPGAVLGGPPQDLHFSGDPSYVVVGDYTQIREYVTIHRGAQPESTTRVGSHCMLMAYCHVAHDCQLGDHVIFANGVTLAGYVSVGDRVFISGMCVVHQFVKIGRMAIIGGFSGTRQDVPPFAKADGRPEVTLHGINVVGLKRNGVSRESRLAVQKAYHLLWFSKLNLNQALARIQEEIPAEPLVDELIEFVKNSKRGIRRPDSEMDASEGPENSDSPLRAPSMSVSP